MKKKRTATLFTHILAITILPVSLVFAVVIVTLNSVLTMSVTNHTKETVQLTAVQISEQASVRIEGMEVLQKYVSREMAEVDIASPNAGASLDAHVRSLLSLSPDAYCVWFVLEPEVLGTEARYAKEYIRTPTGIAREIKTFSDLQLDFMPRYQEPLKTGRTYFDCLTRYDYGLGEGSVSILSIVNPIIRNNQVIGCVGMDIRYESLLRIEKVTGDTLQQKIMVVANDSSVLFSFEREDIGKRLADFGFGRNTSINEAFESGDVWLEEIDSPFFEGRSIAVLQPFSIHGMDQTMYLYRGVSRAQLYERYQTSIDIIITAGILGAVLIAFCVFVSTRRIVRHTRRLSESFRLVADFDSETPVDFEITATPSTNVRELDMLQEALSTLMLHMQKAHYLTIESLKARVENEKLQASAQAKTAFFASMSHEIRTPMNAVIGITEIMLTKGGLSKEQEKDIRDIRAASNSLLSIINDIMDVSKMETGKISLLAESYDFEAMVDNLASLARHLASESGLEFRLELEEDLPKCLYGDDARVRQVLLNLLGNAVKYTREGYVLLRVSKANGNLRFDVVDTGIGIKDKDIDSVFKSFTRVDTRKNRKVTGTGLGLSICKHLVDIMGGEIKVESRYGLGSTFTVIIPIVLGDESKLRHAGERNHIRFTDDLHVLVVDDNRVNLNVTSGLMKVLFGLTCDLVESGAEAIRLIQKNKYDLVFMDHMMPEMDGADTTRVIRSLGEPYKSLPIIALTANAVIGTREELLASGMDGFITKPIRREELQDIMYHRVPKEKQIIVPHGDDPVISPAAGPLPSAVLEYNESESNAQDEDEAPPAPVYQIKNPDVLALQSVRELDLMNGLDIIGYDEEMYLESIKILSQLIPQTMDDLHKLLAEKRIDDFKIVAHGIKGSFLNVGAKELAAYALKFEQAAERGDIAYCSSQLKNFTRCVIAFREALPLPMEPAPLAPDANADEDSPSISAEHIDTLMQALETYDYEKIAIAWDAITLTRQNDETRALLESVRADIDAFDYTAAAEHLSACKL